MRALTKCSGCGTESTVDWVGGHCLPCLLRLGLETDDAPLFHPGDRIGSYRLIDEIGEGGCGIVFLAEQLEPVRRQVALKVIKPGMDTRQVIARFEAERQVLALLDHPHIAKVFDAGATDAGRPFFAMELVRGAKITDYCDREKLSVRQRLELFATVCQAIQYAHQKGVIHRDLKPSNILVTGGENGLSGTPRIIDFGIAKSTEHPLGGGTAFTRPHQFLGTPAYMSPEQAGRGEVDIDTRSDIYSLGVLLYEILTGSTPFDAAELERCGWDEMPRFIRETEPLKPSERLARKLVAAPRQSAADLGDENGGAPPRRHCELIRQLCGDLDWIVMKCLEKDRARRYETAHALQLDVQHYLCHEPVIARPPTSTYRLQKFVRRNRIAFTAAVVVVLTLLAGLTISTWSFLREREAHRRAVIAETTERQAREQADAARQRALLEARKTREVAAFLVDVLKGAGPSVSLGHDTTVLREILNKTILRLGRDLQDQPDVEAELRNTLAEVCGQLGLYPQMEEMARQALRFSRPRADVENLFVAKALEQLAEALRLEGRLNDAETAARESLAMRKRLSGDQSAEASASLNNLGLVLRDRRQFAGAEKIFREALAIDMKLFGHDNPSVAAELANLGAVLWSQEYFAEAETAYREALDLRRKLSGNESPEAATALNNLATVLLSEHKLTEAESAAREALAFDRKFLGNEHPDLAITLGNLGNILNAQGKLAEAEALRHEAESGREDKPSGSGK